MDVSTVSVFFSSVEEPVGNSIGSGIGDDFGDFFPRLFGYFTSSSGNVDFGQLADEMGKSSSDSLDGGE